MGLNGTCASCFTRIVLCALSGAATLWRQSGNVLDIAQAVCRRFHRVFGFVGQYCVQCAKCFTRSFLSESACWSCGKEKELQKDSYVDEMDLIAPWPRQSGGGMTSGSAARPASTAKGPAQVLAQSPGARKGFWGCPENASAFWSAKVLKEEAEMKQAQPMGQSMDQARARFRRAVEAGEKAQGAMLKAQANFEQAQQEVIRAQMDLDKLMQEAPLPVTPVPQVNVSLVKSVEALTGLIENMWNPEAGPPPDQLIHAIQESRGAVFPPPLF